MKNSKKNAGDVLIELAQLFDNRSKVYKDNYINFGKVMAGLFPDGITLKTEEDHVRFHLFILAIVKLTRYSNNWKSGHSDSSRDSAVYMAMLEAFDGNRKTK